MTQQLSLSARPISLDGLVGQERLVVRIREHMASGRVIKAWLLTGPTGCGKTTTARILALAFQCTHQSKFGLPCKECRAAKSQFDIYEHNAALRSGKEDMSTALEGLEYAPRVGQKRVYIIDEVHASSKAAQSLILKALEDAPESTIFILCSAVPHQVDQMIQGRCLCYQMLPLDYDGTQRLVLKLLKKVDSSLPADRLVEALVSRGVAFPRLIAQAVEKYSSGAEPEEAAIVSASEVIDTKDLCRALIKGDWPGVAAKLQELDPANVRAVRLSVLAYLRVLLLNSAEIEERATGVAKAISALCEVQNAEDMVVAAAMASALYTVSSSFAKYKF